MELAHRLGVDLLIDDGLLISGNSVLAGNSAKREKTRLGAVRAALFTDETQAREMREKIREANPNGILILGTSPDMIEKITERLELPPPSEYIAIEDVTTQRERNLAQKVRRKPDSERHPRRFKYQRGNGKQRGVFNEKDPALHSFSP